MFLAAGAGVAAGPIGNQNRTPQAVSTADADLEDRLNALRRN